MAVETRTNYSRKQYFLKGSAKRRDRLVVGFGADGRNTDGDMVKFTVMCENSAGNLVPLTSLTAINGTSVPVGLLAGTLTEAELEAATTGQTVSCELFESAEAANEDEIVFDGASPTITLNSQIVELGGMTVRQALKNAGIALMKSTDVTNYETPA